MTKVINVFFARVNKKGGVKKVVLPTKAYTSRSFISCSFISAFTTADIIFTTSQNFQHYHLKIFNITILLLIFLLFSQHIHPIPSFPNSTMMKASAHVPFSRTKQILVAILASQSNVCKFTCNVNNLQNFHFPPSKLPGYSTFKLTLIQFLAWWSVKVEWFSFNNLVILGRFLFSLARSYFTSKFECSQDRTF